MQSPTHFPYCCYIRGGSRNSGTDSQGTDRERQVEVTRLLFSVSHQSAAQPKSYGKTGMGYTEPHSYPRSTGEGSVNGPTRSPSKRWLLVTKSPAKNRLYQKSAWKDCQGFINTHTHTHTHTRAKSCFLSLKPHPSSNLNVSDSGMLLCTYTCESKIKVNVLLITSYVSQGSLTDNRNLSSCLGQKKI